MPRMQPPAGFMSAKEARERLQISDTLLRRYVQQGDLKRYGPVGQTQRPWYKEGEVEALFHARQMLEEAYVKGSYKKNPVSSFGPADEADMPAIIDIDTRTFNHPAAPLETCLTWLRRNRYTFFALKDAEGVVRAYASLIPMNKRYIEQFVRDELKGDAITAEMIDEYVDGRPMHIYVMAIAVDPVASRAEKSAYGRRIIQGLFDFLFELAAQGVDIRSITARNYMQEGGLKKPDGLRLLRKMGFTQLRSPVPGVGLFVVNVPESGIAIYEKYSDILAAWKREHGEKTA